MSGLDLTPSSSAPTVTCVPAMDRMAEYRFEKVTLIKSNLQKCKEQVRKGTPFPSARFP